MDEARKVIQRLERIEALKSSHAPAEELLGEVRQLLTEGEAWLAAERDGDRRANGSGEDAIEDAEAALAGCRQTIAGRQEVMPEATGATH